MSLKKGLRLTIDAILGEDKAENKPAKSVEEVNTTFKKQIIWRKELSTTPSVQLKT